MTLASYLVKGCGTLELGRTQTGNSSSNSLGIQVKPHEEHPLHCTSVKGCSSVHHIASGEDIKTIAGWGPPEVQ
jgi:hypothetical protein